jgi:hypothetical protein
MLPLEDVVTAHGMTMDDWHKLQDVAWFKALLINEITAWQSAESTPERVKLKFQYMVEQSQSEFFNALVDSKANLGDRVKLLQQVMKGAGIGDAADASAPGSGQRVSITINMGDDVRTFEKTVTPRVIDSTINREQLPFELESDTSEAEEPNFDEADEDEFDRLMKESV